ncbi:metal-dependent hydrolase [Veronia pacifica]|uniref:Hydrolase n=1 Tax=Veronia pacifica TaxID=1080227 RepID=A0A1C3EM35_9GAMM|nr:metal-dependent hydrolase [Veronia pacifica]ODA34285.1 hydrolase [Veronia pacifica]
MDSVTQAALGATVAGIVAGKECRPKHLLAGALLGTLPDMDVLLDHGDPLSDMIGHRGFSHSLFFLLPLSGVLAFLWHKYSRTEWSLGHVFLFCLMTLTTHPMLDSFTSYGTRLFWPIFPEPIGVSSIFIIDPVFTIPLLLGLLGALLWREKAARLCTYGMVLSSAYLLWSVAAMEMIKYRTESVLVGTSMKGQSIFITPTPFNTLLWRVVVRDENTQWETLLSLLDKGEGAEWLKTESGKWPNEDKPELIRKFESFTDGFIRYTEEDNQLIATDIRLGMAEYHPFSFIVANWDSGRWQAQTPVQIEPGPVVPGSVPAMWLRLLGDQNIDARLCKGDACYGKK